MLTLCSPMLALEMRSPIAVTETTDVATRWGGGGNGSPQAGAAAGAVRLATEGFRQGHGLWPAPGFKG